MGSSGSQHDLATALDALPASTTVTAATAGGGPGSVRSSREFVADYLPGEVHRKRAQLVVCNGGARRANRRRRGPARARNREKARSASQHAMHRARGCGPAPAQRQGDGRCRASAVEHLLTAPAFAAAAGRLAQSFATQDAPRTFAAVVARCWATGGRRCHSRTSVGCRSLIFFAGMPPHSSWAEGCVHSRRNPR